MGITIEKVIRAPRERVFAAAADFANAAGTIRAITRVEMLSQGPVGVGTTFRETRKVFGREATEEMTVVEFVPPERYVLGAESHGCRYRSALAFASVAGGTRVTMTFAAEPLTLVAKVLSFLMRPMFKSMTKECAKDLDDLEAAVTPHLAGALPGDPARGTG